VITGLLVLIGMAPRVARYRLFEIRPPPIWQRRPVPPSAPQVPAQCLGSCRHQDGKFREK
jgi:hypothetical protein